MYRDLYTVCALAVVVTAVCTLLFNMLVIAAYFKMPKSLKKKVPNIMAVNQACADISSIVPSLLIATVVYLLLGENTYNAEVHRMYWVFFLYTNYLVVLSLLLSTFDRFINLKFPGNYHRAATERKAIVVILLTWVISAVPPILYKSSIKVDVYSYFTGVFTVLLLLAVIVLILLLVTFKILRREIIEQTELMISLSATEAKEEEQKHHLANERRLVCILLTRTCTYMCTLLPHIILRLVVLHRDALKLHHSVGHWLSLTYLIYSFNGVLDPLLTIFLRQDFHRARSWMTFGYLSPKTSLTRVCEETVVSDEL